MTNKVFVASFTKLFFVIFGNIPFDTKSYIINDIIITYTLHGKIMSNDNNNKVNKDDLSRMINKLTHLESSMLCKSSSSDMSLIMNCNSKINIRIKYLSIT